MNLKKEIKRALSEGCSTLEQIAERLNTDAENPALAAAFAQLLEYCEIVENKSGRVNLPEAAGLCRGRLELTRSGYGFVRHEGGDIFVKREDMRGAFNGQTVLASVEGSADRLSGRVLRVSAEPFFVTGKIERMPAGTFLTSEDSATEPLKVSKKDIAGAEYGQLAVARLTKCATAYHPPEGKLVEILGFEGDPGVDVLTVARRFGLHEVFPGPVLVAARALCEPTERELDGRELLFDSVVFTIDGEDAKDLDDAVSIEQKPDGGFELGVHIADVSHYVREDGLIDREAAKRTTSAYLLDRVIPMLPKELSNGLCSLNEGVTRLTVSCFMDVSPEGEVTAHRLARTAIRTKHRMTYTDVNAMLRGDSNTLAKYSDIAESVEIMGRLAALMRARRYAAGAIDFDIPEAKIELDAEGRPVSIGLRVHDLAEQLIEEFMIAANCSAAEDFFYCELPFMYRVHERPDPKKLRTLSVFLRNMGIPLKGGSEPHGRALQEVLDETADMPFGSIVKRMMLRTMKKARYSAVNAGHFGLSKEAYCHFTSPIRRYPDLIVHRLIKKGLDGGFRRSELKRLEKELPAVASACCDGEINAAEAERCVEDIKKAEYMSERIGDSFDGVISGVTQYVLFVELPDTVEGVMPLSSLADDYYEYNEAGCFVMGKRLRKKYTMGDPVRVKLVSADPRSGRIEFSPETMKKQNNVVRYKRRR